MRWTWHMRPPSKGRNLTNATPEMELAGVWAEFSMNLVWYAKEVPPFMVLLQWEDVWQVTADDDRLYKPSLEPHFTWEVCPCGLLEPGGQLVM